MYHAIGGPGEQASRYILPRAQFERQLAWLRARHYKMLSLRQILDSRHAGIPAPRAVALTFDDGYEDNASALLGSGAPATIFVVTGAAGATNAWDATGPLRGRKLLGWEELRRARAAGAEIGGHSRTHPILPELPPADLQEELNGSLADLRRELGPGFYTFAYPHGRFDEETKRALDAARAGDETRYAAAVCSRGGVNDPWVPLDELRRVEIKGTDGFLSFILMVSLGRRITPGQLLRSFFFG
jgi:peptidoglycan/xylan/chitin deacetylase (PgdA/CDA1 family)